MPVSREGLLPVITKILDGPIDTKTTSLDAVLAENLIENFFVVDRSADFVRGSQPISGHFNFDFTTEGGRQFARDLAHDLLLAADQQEAKVIEDEAANINKIANVLLATTELDAKTAKKQAKALFDAGISFPHTAHEKPAPVIPPHTPSFNKLPPMGKRNPEEESA